MKRISRGRVLISLDKKTSFPTLFETLESRVYFGKGSTTPTPPNPTCGCPTPPAPVHASPTDAGKGAGANHNERPTGKQTSSGPVVQGGGGPALINGFNPSSAVASQHPVAYNKGNPIITSTDLISNAFGQAWGQVRTWAGINDSGMNGNGWEVSDLPYLNTLVRQQFGGMVQLVMNGGSADEFTLPTDGTTYSPRGQTQSTLNYIPPITDGYGNKNPGQFELTDVAGNVTTFYDLARDSTTTYGGVQKGFGHLAGNSTYPQEVTNQWFNTSTGATGSSTNPYRFGAFKSFRAADGKYNVNANYDSSGNLVSVVRNDGSSAYERFYYEYSTVANSATSGTTNLISRVSLQKGTSGTGSPPSTWTTIRSAIYQYYTGEENISGSAVADVNGRLGDLRQVTITDPTSQKSVSSITFSGTTATATSTSHGYQVGDLVTISGASNNVYNGTYQIASVTTNTFTFTVRDVPANSASGTITATNKQINVAYYRYYKFHGYGIFTSGTSSATNIKTISNDSGTGGTGGGDTHFLASGTDNAVFSGLKAVVEGSAFARLAASYPDYDQLADVDITPGTDANGDGNASNDDIRSYADNFFRYERYNLSSVASDSHGTVSYRVIEETAASAGCSTCSGGFGTTRFAYSVNNSYGLADPYDAVDTGLDPNKWNIKTVEFLPDETNALATTTLSSGQLTRSGSTATITWTANHFAIGDHISISGATQTQYNGAFVITDVTANTFSFQVSGTPTSPGTGTITVTNYDHIAESSWADNNSTIVYTNEVGQAMLEVEVDTTTLVGGVPTQYVTYTHYDSSDQADYIVHSAAILGYSETLADLIDFSTNGHNFVANSSGLIEHYQYGDSTTATTTTPGNAAGYLQSYSIRQGYSGTDKLVSTENYVQHTYSTTGASVYPVADQISYVDANLDGTDDAETTHHSYTWQNDASSVATNQIKSDTVSNPAVSTSRHGSGSATQTVTVFDADGRSIWTKDADGFISYTQYDPSTGTVSKSISDVNTTQTSDFSDLPSGWSTPTGGGTHLITTADVDGLGRTTKLTDPKGYVTYTVYNDAAHEVRTYRGWTGTTTTGPIEVTRTYWPVAGASSGQRTVYTEMLTSSATPTSSSGVPTGLETISSSNIQSFKRSLTNDAGQKVEEDFYYSLSGVTYSQSSPILGTASNDSSSGNYHAMMVAYDGQGRIKRQISPTGTITRTLYDSRGLPTSTWVGTDDTPTSGYWSPTNSAGTNLVETSATTYDNEGNATSVTQFPNGSTAPRVTRNLYDWRDRLVVSKQGVQSTESADTQRPLTYYQYDNQNNVVSTEQYDSDNIYDFTPNVMAPKIADPGFEIPVGYNPEDPSPWDIPNDEGYTSGPISSQNTGNILHLGPQPDIEDDVASASQTINGWAGGTYTLSVDVAGSDAYSADYGFQIVVDGTPVGTFTGIPVTNTLSTVTSSSFTVAAGTQHTITLQTYGPNTAAHGFCFNNIALTKTVPGSDANNDGVPDRPSSSLLRAKTTTAYDDQGRVYETNQYSVDPSSGATTGGSLADDYWYDARGNLVKSSTPTGLVTKTLYNGVDWPTKTYQTDGGGDSVYGDASNVTGDAVLTQTATTYDADGNAILLTTKDRFHDTTATGELGNTTTSPNARVSYVENYYDALDRQTAMVNIGTNGGSAFTRDSSVPTRSDTKLVTSYTYNDRGDLGSTTDPLGLVSTKSYDLLGRTTKTIANYIDGIPSNSDDQTIQYTYDGNDHVLTMKAVLPGSGNFQETKYIYATQQSAGSSIDSNDVLSAIQYPDLSTGSASSGQQETFKTDALGERTSYTDRNGTTHAYSYDVMGRLLSDDVTGHVGSGVDGTITKHAYTYDSAGLPLLFTSYGPTGTVLNQVERIYNGLGQVVTEYQEHSGAVNTSTTLKVQYAYGDPSAGSLKSEMIYPDGRTLEYGDYSVAGNAAWINDDKYANREALEYLGLNTIVFDSREDLELSYFDTSSTGDAGDQYVGYDRFGRLVEKKWSRDVDSAVVDDFQYGYDRDGNIAYKVNAITPSNSEIYTYDGLNRLTSMTRGTLNSSHTAVTGTPTLSKTWNLDVSGNWGLSGYDKQNGDTSQLTYDANGNTLVQSINWLYTYDAWNHLASSKIISPDDYPLYETIMQDALGRRIQSTIHSSSDPDIGYNTAVTTDVYYNTDWQDLEERSGSTVEVQSLWTPGYVDDLAAQDIHGVLGERFYSADANYNQTGTFDYSDNLVSRQVFDPYGAGSTGGFQGGMYDSFNGTYNFRNRDYLPAFGRWLQQDPFQYSDGLNLYQTELSNPQKYLDPMGLTPNRNDSRNLDWLLKQARDLQKNNPNRSPCELVGNMQDLFNGNPKYVYTKSAGWMDLNHFFNASQHYYYTSIIGGLAVELLQSVNAITLRTEGVGSSAFNYEDLPSNAEGAEFGAFVRSYEGTNSNGCPTCNATSLEQMLQDFFRILGAAEPSTAPDWNQLPYDEYQHEKEFLQDSTGYFFTGDYMP